MIHALIPRLQFNGRGAIATIAVPDSVGEEAALEGDCSGGGGGVSVSVVVSFRSFCGESIVLFCYSGCVVLCCGVVW